MRLLSERRSGAANERDTLAIGRPGGTRVVIDARRKERHVALRNVVNTDERVVDAIADERDLLAVRRPFQIAVRAPCFYPRSPPTRQPRHSCLARCWPDRVAVD